MTDERFLLPIDTPYLEAVGLAVFCFARLEWDAVWCCEKIQPGYIHTVGTKTAGQIANGLVQLAANYSDVAIQASLGLAATQFKGHTKRRNDLMHGNPGTASSGDQRLFRNGREWTIPELNVLADEFTAAGGLLNRHHHHLL